MSAELTETRVHVLLVEDDSDDYLLTRGLLREGYGEFVLDWEATYEGGLAAIARGGYDVVLLDYRLGERTGVELLREAGSRGCQTPIILLTGQRERETDLAAMRAGATDYLAKDGLDAPILERSIRYALERKRGIDALSRLAAVVESSADAIVGTTLEGIIEAWSRGAESLYGYSAQEAIGHSIGILHPGTRDELRSLTDTIRSGKRVSDLETVRRRKDGRLIDILLTIAPILDAAGNPIATSAISRDITERKRVRAELERRENEFRVLVERSPDIITRLDRDGRHLYVNPAIELATGMPMESFLGKTHRELHLSEEACAAWEEGLRMVLARGWETRLVFSVESPTGERVYDARLVPEIELDGSIPAVMSVARDITERIEAEKTIRFQAELLDTIGEAVIATELDGTITYWNRAAEALYGWSSREVVGKNVVDVTPAEMSVGQAEEIMQRLSAGESWSGEFLVRRKGGATFPARVTDAPVRAPDGALTGIVGISGDLTERKRAEEERERLIQQIEAERGRLANIFMQAPAYICTLRGPDHVFETANPPYVRLTGHRELIGLPGRVACPELEEQGLFKVLDEVYRTGVPFVGKAATVGFRPEPGAPLEEGIYDFVFQPMTDASGAIIGVFVHAVDVAESVRARQEVERLAAERGAILRQITEGVVVVDPCGRINFVNDAGARMLGLELLNVSIEELRDTHQMLTLAGDPFPNDELPLSRALAGETITGLELLFVRPDGSRIVLEAAAAPVLGENGTLLGMVLTTRDITERLREQAKLAAAEAHYRRLVEYAPYPIFALDLEGKFTELNPAGKQTLGYAAEDLLGEPFASIIAREDLHLATDSFQKTLLTGSDEAEMRIVRLDGTRRLIHLRAAAVVENGERVGTHGVARDITDERARDERMRLLATALEGLDSGVSIVDSEARFVYTNSAHARLYGYDRDRLPEVSALDLIVSPDPRAEFAALLARAREGTFASRVTRRRVDGQDLPVHTITGRIEHLDRELILVITRDITQELVLEQQMHRAERLASMGTLLSGVAHELNNPLHAIGNFAELLLMEPRTAEDKEALEIMQREAERAAKVVCDLRIIARQTQDAATSKDMVDLNDVVRHVLKLRRYKLDTHNIQVHERLIPSLPSIWASGPEMEQVVLNLVINAEQAMGAHSEGGQLYLRTSSARSRVILQITDTGPGIPQENVGRVFDPFFTTKAPGEGTGLGLSLVHSIVIEHGGEIRVSSSDRGTTFTVELPCAPESEAQAAAPELGKPQRSLRVLVVDDERSIRRSVQICLQKRGHQVELAQNGAEALRLIDERGDAGFDVILSDLRMPGFGGEQLLTHLQARHSGLERRVVFMTGDAASEDASRILEATGIPALIKPVKLDAIVQVIEETDRRRRTT